LPQTSVHRDEVRFVNDERPPDGSERNDDEAPSTGRLLALTDGVVAIALTLLVLRLQVPVNAVLKHHTIPNRPRTCGRPSTSTGMNSLPT
jgi:hypothetical protein